MKKPLFLNLLLVLLVSCMQTITLQNGRTKVPADPKVYANVDKFNKSLLSIIDTEAIYESFNQNYNILDRLDTHIETVMYEVFLFYSNGRFNSFFLNRNNPLIANDFNPEFTGYRGVYYVKDNQIHYDLFAEIDGVGSTGKIAGTFKFSGDTLYVKRDRFPQWTDIYIKRKLPSGYLDYKADW